MKRITWTLFLLLLYAPRDFIAQTCLPADEFPGPYICWPLINSLQSGTDNFTPDPVTDQFCGTIENNSWFSFSPCASSVAFSITAFNCVFHHGIQAVIFDQQDQIVSNCYSPGFPGTGIVMADGLVPGEIYHFMIDGFAGDICDYQIVALEGIAPPDPNTSVVSIPGYIDGPTEVCKGMTATYTVTPPYCVLFNIEGRVSCPTPDLSAFFDTLYYWQLPAGAIIQSDATAQSIEVLWSSVEPGTLSVSMELVPVSSSCGTAACASGMAIGDCELVSVPLEITIREPQVNFLPKVILCEGECFEVAGQQFCESGHFEIQLTTQDQCDSIVVFDVEVYLNTVQTVSETLCLGDCIVIGGQQFCNPGQYEIHLNTWAGCDSLILLDLQIRLDDLTFLPTVTLCEGDCFWLGGRRFCAPGPQQVVLTNEFGCDSTIHFSIEVLKSIRNELPSVRRCQGDCYAHDGQVFCASGIYEMVYPAQNGCDSTVVLNIQFDRKDETLLPPVKLCRNECFTIAGQKFCTPGNHSVSLVNQAGCDSVVTFGIEIRELSLTVEQPEILTSEVLNVGLHGIRTGDPTGLIFHWRGPGLPENGIEGLDATTTLPGTYVLTAIDTALGCTASASVEVFQTEKICRKNQPVSPASSCAEAPFLCGENLDGFCGNVFASTPFAPGNLRQIISAPIENNQWIRWTPCDQTAVFRVATMGCVSGRGLELSVLQTGDCEQFSVLLDSRILLHKTIELIRIDNLQPGLPYLMMLDGVGSDFCDFQIEVVSGVSTVPLIWEEIKPGSISGDKYLCPDKETTYAISIPEYQINGMDACVFGVFMPDFSTAKVKWHLPEGLRIIGDSTGHSIRLVLPESFLFAPGRPLLPAGELALGQIWAEFQENTDLPAGLYCSLNGAFGGLQPMKVFFNHELIKLPSIDLCQGNCYDYCGQQYCTDAVVTCREGCQTIVQEINVHEPLSLDYGDIKLCKGTCFTMPRSGQVICQEGSHTISLRTKCGGTESVSISFYETEVMEVGPVTEICDPTNASYTISFDVVEGVPPIRVNGHIISDKRFLSDRIPNATPYDFVVTDSSKCVNQRRVSGMYDCGPLCNSEAGTMGSEVLEACENDEVTGIYLGDGIPDGDDTRDFVLHTNGGTSLGTVLSRDVNARFAFHEGQMEFDRVYYISHVVGNSINGEVDLNDPCLSVSAGQPVIFKKQPDSNIPGTLELTCDQPVGRLSAGIVRPDVSVRWVRPNGTISRDPIIRVTEAGVYRLELTNTGGCTILKDVLVTDNRALPTVEIANPPEFQCNTKSMVLDAQKSSAGEQFVYQWSTVDGHLLSGMQSLSPVIDVPGTYVLTITNRSNQCRTKDSVLVLDNKNIPKQATFDVVLPTCYGHSDGRIELMNIEGGVPPFLISFDEGGFVEKRIFEALKSGTYVVEIRDQNHCRLIREVNLPEPPPIDVELGDDHFIKLGEEITLTAAASIHPARVKWHNGSGETFEGALEWAVKPSFSDLYHVSVFDPNGCQASDEVKVYVEQTSVYLPSAFSPNGDHQNDYFAVYGSDNVRRILTFRVFDRRGQLLFENRNFEPVAETFGWDGTFKSKPMPSEVYAFFVEIELINGEVKLLKGDVTLIR